MTTLQLPKCKCGYFPIWANGRRADGLWVVLVACREPESHPEGDKFNVVTFSNSSLEAAEREAEEIWCQVTRDVQRLS